MNLTFRQIIFFTIAGFLLFSCRNQKNEDIEVVKFKVLDFELYLGQSISECLKNCSKCNSGEIQKIDSCLNTEEVFDFHVKDSTFLYFRFFDNKLIYFSLESNNLPTSVNINNTVINIETSNLADKLLNKNFHFRCQIMKKNKFRFYIANIDKNRKYFNCFNLKNEE